VTHSVAPVLYDAGCRADFQATLKARVFTWLDSLPNGRKATPFMWFKVVFFVTAWWSLWALLALVPHGPGLTLGLLLTFALTSVALAYNVSHDAVHHALARRTWVNDALFHLTFNPLGPSAHLWRLRHTIMHHNCVNVPGLDFNIEAAGILRFSPTQPWRPLHRWQHLYAPFAYMIFTLHWVFVKDVQLLFERRIGNVEGISHPWSRVARVFAWKLFYVGIMLVVPALVLPYGFGAVLAGFLLYQAVTSFLLVLTFTGSHLNQGMVFVEAGPGNQIPHGFFEHALLTSLDFHPRSPFFSFFLGGFNAHVAHHMFPQVCSVHYPEITRIIQQTAAEYGLPYREMNIVELFVSHFRYLAELGRGRDEPRAAYLHGHSG
jgi:linoleoyl-CoA desaturase